MTARTRAFADQAAVVTGASGAIGGAVARGLAAEGAALLLSGRSRERLDDLAARLREDGARAEVHAADLALPGEPEALARRALVLFGEVDLLVHALGAWIGAPIADTPTAELDRQLAVNLRVPWELTRALLPALVRRRGQVAFVNSSSAVAPRGPVAAYAASKAALRAFAEVLRDEVNRDGVRVLSVFPGRTASAMQEVVCATLGQTYRPERLLQPGDVAEALLAALRLPRTAEVTDLHLRPMVGL
jgi:short-subunit dehydrogenase